jgi:hypothetical protein
MDPFYGSRNRILILDLKEADKLAAYQLETRPAVGPAPRSRASDAKCRELPASSNCSTSFGKGGQMARQTFFSFHYERDVWRAGQVRNSWVTKDREAAGFWDSASWEEVKKKGDSAVKAWIDTQLKGTSVTVVLIGAETSMRPYVDYEITQSHSRGNGLLGIYIHNMKGTDGETHAKGGNPFSKHVLRDSAGRAVSYPIYDWVNDDGRNKIGEWIEAAAKKAGR